jgi:peptide/nickel transport system substrate-binding protein
MEQRQFGRVLLAAILLLMAFASGGHAAPQDAIVIAQVSDPLALDPHAHESGPTYSVLLNIYDTLLFRDRDLKIVPWLAESWRLVDPLTWEFKIRPGVKFHNGESLDAEAVKWSLDRLRAPEKKNVQAGHFRLVTAVEVVDKRTVRIITARPFSTLPNQLALRGAIMPPRHFQRDDKALVDRQPIGTGAYKFARWRRDEELVLEANDRWWGGAPSIKRVIFRSIPEDAVRVAALQAGEIDVAVNIPPHLVPLIQKHPRLYVSRTPSVRTIFIPIYTHRFDSAHQPLGPVDGPTSDRRVRQAIQVAVNPSEIISAILEGQAIRTASVLTSGHFGFDRTIPLLRYDPTRARSLLAEAGYPNGIDLTLNSPRGRYPKDKEVAEAVAGQLSRTGIRTTVRAFEFNTYGNLVFSHKAGPMFLIGWGNATWDADASLSPLFQSGNPFPNYLNEEFNRLLDEARTSIDDTHRLNLFARAQRLMLEDGAVVPLYQQTDIYGVNKRFRFQALSSEQLVAAWMTLAR